MVQQLGDTDDLAASLASADRADALLVVYYTAAWCGPCRQVSPVYQALADSQEWPFVQFVKADVDEVQELAAQQRITAMPTFQLWRQKTLVAQMQGADVPRLRALLAAHGGPNVHLKKGAAVTVGGLRSRPELNGASGRVICYDPASERYQVEIDGTVAPLALKREALCARLRVELRGQEGRSHATLRAHVADRAYEVEFDDGSSAEVALECVVLPSASTGIVVGLVSKPEHNGKSGRVLSFDAEADRYVVALDASSQLRLKRSNLRV